MTQNELYREIENQLLCLEEIEYSLAQYIDSPEGKRMDDVQKDLAELQEEGLCFLLTITRKRLEVLKR